MYHKSFNLWQKRNVTLNIMVMYRFLQYMACIYIFLSPMVLLIINEAVLVCQQNYWYQKTQTCLKFVFHLWTQILPPNLTYDKELYIGSLKLAHPLGPYPSLSLYLKVLESAPAMSQMPYCCSVLGYLSDTILHHLWLTYLYFSYLWSIIFGYFTVTAWREVIFTFQGLRWSFTTIWYKNLNFIFNLQYLHPKSGGSGTHASF